MLADSSGIEPSNNNLSFRDIEIEDDSNFGSARKDYYDGTISGWIDKYRGLILTFIAILSIIIISISIVIIYSKAGDDDDIFDDEDCWPFSCPSEDTDTTIDEDTYYWDNSNVNISTDYSWGFRLPSPTNRALLDIIHFTATDIDYHYAAVGDDSSILVSTNGSYWELFPPITSSPDLVSISYSADTFYVEASDGSAFYSTNLVSWYPSLHSFSSGIASNDIISIGIEHNTALIRDLSLTWINTYIHDADTLNDVSYGNGIFIVLGTTHYVNQPDALYAAVWISEDGYVWDLNLVSGDILENSEDLQLTKAPTIDDRGIFLVFADKLYSSASGVVWLPVDQTPWISSAAPSKLDCGGNGYCSALSQSGEQTVMSQSTDFGQTWTSTIVGAKLYGLTDNNGYIFTSVGSNGAIVQGISNTQVNGIVWSQVAPQYGEQISSVTFGDSEFVASSENFVTFTSQDGVSWTRNSSPSLSYISHGNGVYIGVYSSGLYLNIYSSSSVLDWSVSESYEGFYKISHCTYDGHQFIICVEGCTDCSGFDDDDENNDSSLSNIIYTSSDGYSWNEHIISTDIRAFVDFAWDSVSDCYYAVTEDGLVYTSSDINLWRLRIVGSDLICSAIAANQQTGTSLVVCTNDNNEMVLGKSLDCGSSWDLTTCNCNCGKINTIYYNYEDNTFYIGGNTIIKTIDGKQLEITSINPVTVDTMNTILINNGILMALSQNAIISSSIENSPFTELTC